MCASFPDVLDGLNPVHGLSISSGVAQPAGPELAYTRLTLGLDRAGIPSASRWTSVCPSSQLCADLYCGRPQRQRSDVPIAYNKMWTELLETRPRQQRRQVLWIKSFLRALGERQKLAFPAVCQIVHVPPKMFVATICPISQT